MNEKEKDIIKVWENNIEINWGKLNPEEKEKMISFLENKKKNDEILKRIITKDELENLRESIQNNQINSFFEKNKNEIKENSNKNPIDNLFKNSSFDFFKNIESLYSIPFIWWFIKSIIDFIKWNFDFLKNSENNLLQDVILKISEKWSFLNWLKIPENFWKDKEWNLDSWFINSLKWISKTEKDNDFWKNIEKIFDKNSPFANFVKNDTLKKLWEKAELSDNNWNINFQNLKFLVSIFSDFSEEKEENQNLTIENFIKNITWDSENKIEIIENKEENKEENKQNQAEKQKTEEKKENFEIREEEWLKIWTTKIDFVLKNNWQKFKLTLKDNWELKIIWENWDSSEFYGWKEIFEKLSSFKWILKKDATAADFWKWPSFYKLWQTIEEILINWYKDEEWIKTACHLKFFEWGKLKKWDVNFSFLDKNITLSNKA